MRKWIALLLVCLFLPASALAATETDVLPDPGLSFFSAGKWLGQTVGSSGTTYDVYGYEVEKKSSTTVSTTISVFQTKVKKAGFSWENLEDRTTRDGFDSENWYAISRGGLTAQLCLEGSYFSTSVTATLYVPKGMPFTLEENVGSRTNGNFQNDIFVNGDELWAPDGGSSTTTCISCHGSGRCSLCNGTGTYTNPYTGKRSDCSCDNGICSICDGQGYWE